MSCTRTHTELVEEYLERYDRTEWTMMMVETHANQTLNKSVFQLKAQNHNNIVNINSKSSIRDYNQAQCLEYVQNFDDVWRNMFLSMKFIEGYSNAN